MNRCLTGGADAGWRELVAAEYAIGGLHGTVRRDFEKRRERDARYCQAVGQWEDRFALLAEMLHCAAETAGLRVAFARPLFWQMASGVLAVAVVLLAIALFR